MTTLRRCVYSADTIPIFFLSLAFITITTKQSPTEDSGVLDSLGALAILMGEPSDEAVSYTKTSALQVGATSAWSTARKRSKRASCAFAYSELTGEPV